MCHTIASYFAFIATVLSFTELWRIVSLVHNISYSTYCSNIIIFSFRVLFQVYELYALIHKPVIPIS